MAEADFFGIDYTIPPEAQQQSTGGQGTQTSDSGANSNPGSLPTSAAQNSTNNAGAGASNSSPYSTGWGGLPTWTGNATPWDANFINAYYQARGVDPGSAANYWVPKYQELYNRGLQLGDPNYAMGRLSAADEFTSRGMSVMPGYTPQSASTYTSGSGNPNMPSDMGPLRQQLSDYLSASLHNYAFPAGYSGPLTTPDPWGLTQAYSRLMAGPDQVARDYTNPIFSTFGGAFGNAMDLVQNGGMQDLNPLFNAIQQRSQTGLNQNLADIREQYGALGLGAGSDVNKALAQGSASGMADMQQQMLQAALQASQASASNRVGALSSLSGLTGAYGNLGLGQGQLWNQSSQDLLAGAGIENQQNQFNVMTPYNDFIRSTSPSPWLNSALAYATGFPPMTQQQSLGPSLISGGASILASILPFLL